MVALRCRVLYATINAMPTMPSTATPSTDKVERNDRNFSHSDLMLRGNVDWVTVHATALGPLPAHTPLQGRACHAAVPSLVLR